MFDQFTLGIEEEFQIVDPETRELKSHVSEILEEGKLLLGEKIKPEMIQSMIEVGTGVCANIQEAREDLSKLRCIISGSRKKKGWQSLRLRRTHFQNGPSRKYTTAIGTNCWSTSCRWSPAAF